MIKSLTKKEWLCIGTIILIGVAIFIYKIHVGILDIQGDYLTYVNTAKFFAGVPGVVPAGQRVLKPLEPLANMLLAPALGWQGSFLFVVGLFYAFLVVATWVFFKDLFKTLFPAELFVTTASATALFCLSYPMLRYGLDAYTETGALLFFILGFLGVWLFMKTPTWRILLLTLVAAVLGFLWKEYVVVPIIILQIAVLWHPQLSGQTRRKLVYLVVFDGLFLLINLLWQLFVYTHFHYDYFQWFGMGRASGAQTNFLLDIPKSLFALLIAGWLFVPFGIGPLLRQSKTVKLFLGLILIVPFICLAWGAVSSRLFYVCTPALIILCVLGMRRWFSRSTDLAAVTIILLALDWAWLLFHL